MKHLLKTILFTFLGFSALAQEPGPPKVLIPLIANGSHHRPTSITADAQVITDDKTPVTGASLVRGADLPLELGMLVDASNSERSSHLGDILKAADKFVGEAIRDPEYRVFFLRFDAFPHATWLKKEQLQGTTIKVGIGGGTALYDAIAMASKERMGPRDGHKPTRRVLVLISDGEDNLSHITREEAASETLKAGAIIFTINMTDFMGPFTGEKVMERLAKLTGGESFNRVGRNDGSKVFASIEGLLDAMYYLRYAPPDASKNSVHEVEVKPAPKEKYDLTYARKYFWNP